MNKEEIETLVILINSKYVIFAVVSFLLGWTASYIGVIKGLLPIPTLTAQLARYETSLLGCKEEYQKLEKTVSELKKELKGMHEDNSRELQELRETLRDLL